MRLIAIIACIAFLSGVYLLAYHSWRKEHIMTYADYPGSVMQLPDKINEDTVLETILPNISKDGLALFNTVYIHDSRKKLFSLKQNIPMEVNDQLFEVLQKTGYKDNREAVFYISSNEEHDAAVFVFYPVLSADCLINNLSIVSE